MTNCSTTEGDRQLQKSNTADTADTADAADTADTALSGGKLPAGDAGPARPFFWLVAALLLVVLWKVAILVTGSRWVAALCMGAACVVGSTSQATRWPMPARVGAALACAGGVVHATSLVGHVMLLVRG